MERKETRKSGSVPAAIGAGGVMEAVSLMTHGGVMGVLVSGTVAALAYTVGPKVAQAAKDLLPDSTTDFIRRNVKGYLPGKYGRDEEASDEQDEDEMEPLRPRPRFVLGDFNAEDELSAPVRKQNGAFLFSQVLANFTPSLDHIYIGTLENGEQVFCRAEDLCHVALAGATRGGKSSIMRMLMSQLCYAGASVLLLNPHHSQYILDKKEDWTPFEPYLVYDPMECRKYEVIEHYLKQTATELLPRRLEKYAHSQPVGRPYFIVLDEVPAIVDHIPDAPVYMKSLLREGAKVGIFLITAATDFLVSTIFPKGGGAIRDCYRTVAYVGGDATTANVLLDMPARDVPENRLGKGTVMLRCDSVRPAALASVPLVDNQALYSLLGPSTYVPTKSGKTDAESDELVSYMVAGREQSQPAAPETRYHSHATGRASVQSRTREREQRLRSTGPSPAVQRQEETAENRLSDDDRHVLDAYRAGKRSGGAINAATHVPFNRINASLHRLAGAGLIDWQPRK